MCLLVSVSEVQYSDHKETLIFLCINLLCIEIESEPVGAGIRRLPGDPGEFSTDPEEDQSAFFSLPGRSLTGIVCITISFLLLREGRVTKAKVVADA